MLTPRPASSVACQEPWSQTAIGKKLGSVEMPLDQPLYGLVHARFGIAGTHADAASVGPPASGLGVERLSGVIGASDGLPAPPSWPVEDDPPPPHANVTVRPTTRIQGLIIAPRPNLCL